MSYFGWELRCLGSKLDSVRVALGEGAVEVAFFKNCLGCELRLSCVLYELPWMWVAFCTSCLLSFLSVRVALGVSCFLYKLPWVCELPSARFALPCELVALCTSCLGCRMWLELSSVRVALGGSSRVRLWRELTQLIASCLGSECPSAQLPWVRIVVWVAFCGKLRCLGSEVPLEWEGKSCFLYELP